MTETYWVIKRLSDGWWLFDTLANTRSEAIRRYNKIWTCGIFATYIKARRRGEVKAVKVRLVEVDDG